MEQLGTLNASSFDPRWEDIHHSRAWGRVPSEHVVRFVHRHYGGNGDGLRALDIGCGIGAQSWFLAGCGFNVVGIDGSASAISRAQARDHGKGYRARFEVADACKLPFEDRSFDAAVDVCCLQHIVEPWHLSAFAELRRVLKQDALFFSVTAKWDHNQMIADTPLRTMRRDELNRLYSKDSGFTIKSADQASYTMNNGGTYISHWLVTARREEDRA